MLTADATDWTGAAGCPDADLGGADLLDAAPGAAVAGLATVADALAVRGALTLEMRVVDVGLAEFVVAVLDRPAAEGETDEMLLTCMIANLLCSKRDLRRDLSTELSKSVARRAEAVSRLA